MRKVTHLHGQLAGHDGGDDNDALQQQLVRGLLLLSQSFLQYVPRGEEREHEEQQQRQPRLLGIAWWGLRC